LILLTF